MSLYLMFKDMVTLAQKAGNLDLVRHLLDVQAQALDQQEEVYRLRQEVEQLKKQLLEAGTVEFFHGLYWRRLSDGQLEGPFSQDRWDLERKLARVTYNETKLDEGVAVHRFICHYAKLAYVIPLTFYQKERIKNADELPKEPPPPDPPRPTQRGFMDEYR